MALWQAVDDLDDHWSWRPDWTEDRTCLLWYLTFTVEPSLHRLAGRLARDLAGVAEVDVVSPPWLHLTLDDLGFDDELDEQAVDEVVAGVADAVGRRRLPELELGPLTTMSDCLVLEAGPAEELQTLRDVLRERLLLVAPAATSRLDDFWPHVSLAYCNAPVTRARLLESVAGLRDARLRVRPQLSLVAVVRGERHYRWTTRAVLTGAAGTRSGPGPRPRG